MAMAIANQQDGNYWQFIGKQKHDSWHLAGLGTWDLGFQIWEERKPKGQRCGRWPVGDWEWRA